MANTLGKFGLLMLGVCFLTAAPVFADSTTFAFVGTLGDIGSKDTFTSGGLSLVATGYSAPGMTADMWAKNESPIETGIGLASQIHHEISGNMFIQLNLTQILAVHPYSVVLVIDSIEAGEAYNVWGSTTAGQLGTMLASHQTSHTFTLTLPDLGKFDYISITTPADTRVSSDVTLEDVDVKTPEPSSASMLLLGLFTLFSAGTLAKKFIA